MNAVMRTFIWAGLLVAVSSMAFACSSSSNTEQGDDACGNCQSDDTTNVTRDSGTDATLLSDACPVQSFPANAAACPATYSISYQAEACSPAGLQCWYPGQGDFGDNGCPEAAMLQCEFPDSGIGELPDAAIFDDAGDASVGYWVISQ